MSGRVAITGGRDHRPTPQEMSRFEALWRELGGTILLHGACPDPWRPPGAVSCDMELDRWAERRGIPRDPFKADWDQHGKAAGPIRNGRMVRTADYLIAFPGNRGTADCIKQAREHGVPVHFATGTDRP